MRVEYHSLAASDLNQAVAYYNQRRTGLGDELRLEVYATISQACASPHLYAIVDQDIRRLFVRHFPYSVLFRVIGKDAIRILVIRHHRRHPHFGLSRR